MFDRFLQPPAWKRNTSVSKESKRTIYVSRKSTNESVRCSPAPERVQGCHCGAIYSWPV